MNILIGDEFFMGEPEGLKEYIVEYIPDKIIDIPIIDVCEEDFWDNDLYGTRNKEARNIFKKLYFYLYMRKASPFFYYKKSSYLSLFVYELPKYMVVFIHKTRAIVERKIRVGIYIEEDSPQHCTHFLIEKNAQGRCRHSAVYMLGVIYSKPIVGFDWYLSLIDSSDIMSVQSLTLLYHVQGDSYFSVIHRKKKFFSLRGIKISGEALSLYAKEMIRILGGVYVEDIKQSSIFLPRDEDLYFFLHEKDQ
ncbi:hypothetical protein NEFER03_1890 [Nematocida sp. LUAm3]|nr:hypothetical protein NEFER03_1890 [Nematocida sp. LUAm3]KAI5173959.1 hypothetical protein NEFER02_0426 [Nematocida sp. LUAm2]KAI5177296.1 hypothetical protein NEFER01_0571 [Nematocida sp. LUAm1]